MKYIVKIGYMEFAFKLAAEALNFAGRAKETVIADDKHDREVSITLVDDDAHEN